MYAQYYYKRLEEQNRSTPDETLINQGRRIVASCKGSGEPLFYLGFCYTLTFIVFPGVTNFPPLTFILQKGPWFQLFLITLFNLCDTIGRYLAGVIIIRKQIANLWQWLRVLQVALIIVIAFVPISTFEGKFGDAVKLANLVVFALGNGYLQTYCCIVAPQNVTTENQENLGMMLTLIINFGIILGSTIQVFLQKLA